LKTNHYSAASRGIAGALLCLASSSCGSGLKWASFPGTPSHSFASAGGIPLPIRFDHLPEYSPIELQPLFEPRFRIGFDRLGWAFRCFYAGENMLVIHLDGE
jgi:hypothetical protein